MSNWKPIESAPKDGTIIIGLIGNSLVVTAWVIGENHTLPAWCCMNPDIGIYLPYKTQPTHWMPLPEPPED